MVTPIPCKGYNSEAGDDKDKLWCDYCNRLRHTRDTCWSLHGRPPMSGGCGGSVGGGCGSGCSGQGIGPRALLSTGID